MNKKLEMNPYLKGLKEIFIKHGIDEAYIDNHALGDDGAPPELYSFALRLLESAKETAHCIYKDGVFYG